MTLPVKPGSAGALAREVGGALTHWLRAQMRICLILAAVYAAGFALAGVPVWPVFALLCGLAHAVPMFGAVAAIALTAAITWAVRGFYPAVSAVLVFAVASALEGFWLTPWIMGRRLRISPWWVFFGGLVAGSLFGFVGLLVAVPVMAVAAVVWRHLAVPR